MSILTKQIALFALLVFFLAQFGKVLNFCFCTIAAYQQTKTLNCDCEKQLTQTIDTESKKQIPQEHPSLPQFDELFHLSGNAGFNFRYTAIEIVWIRNNSETLYNCFLQDIFHPPLPIA